MQFEAIFLEKNAFTKYRLLATIVKHQGPQTIADLADNVHLSYPRTYNLFNELIQDLAVLDQTNSENIRQTLMQTGIDYHRLDAYRYALLTQAIAWQYFDYLIQGHNPNLDQFCRAHFISRSTLNRKVTALRQMLARYHLKLATVDASLTGPEPQLRRCLAQLYWQATHGVSWPFTAVAKAAVKAQLPGTTALAVGLIADQLTMYHLAVARIRLAGGATVPLLAGLEAAPAYFTASRFPHLGEATIAAENAMLAFLQLTAVDQSRTDQQAQRAQLIALMPVVQQDVTVISKAMLTPAECTNVALQTNLLRLAVSFRTYGGNFIKASDFDIPDHISRASIGMYEAAKAVCARLGAPYQAAASAFAKAVVYLLFIYRNANTRQIAVNVCVRLEANDMLHRRLLTFLDNLDFVHRQSNTHLGQCDLLIAEADSLITPQTQAFTATHPDRYFTWCIDATETDFHQLFVRLNAMSNAKMLPYTDGTTLQ